MIPFHPILYYPTVFYIWIVSQSLKITQRLSYLKRLKKIKNLVCKIDFSLLISLNKILTIST